MEFPALFGEASTGKKKLWSITVKDNVISTTHGYDGGKMVTTEKVITEGKNIGKKNETTPQQQAIQEACSTWQKKKDAGYTEITAVTAATSTEAAVESRAKVCADDVPAPMLAHDFNKRSSSITFPCFVQRKYDGTRCVAVPQKGLYSRNRKRYPHLEHILEELAALPSSLILDGELYSTKLTFQEIVGLVKREKLKEGDAEKQLKIEFHVYDIISDAPYSDRYARLQALFSRFKFKYIKFVQTDACADREAMKKLHNKYVAEGYEGIMLRNREGKYKIGQRSADLQKYKEFMDDEYEVVDFAQGDGIEKGCVIWMCKNSEGKTFSCRPLGTHEERAALFKVAATYKGRKLTVRFQELTDEGLPRFPVGVAFRDYE